MPVPECIVSVLDFIAERMTEAVVTTGAIRRAKLQSNHHHQLTNAQLLTGPGCTSCHPINNVRALKGECTANKHTDQTAA